MSKIDDFKLFVRENPSLIKYVKNNEMSWQKFYEFYDLYGADNEIWNTYLSSTINQNIASESGHVVDDFLGWIKTIDLDSVREGVNSIQRVIGVIQDFNTGKPSSTDEYQPRPLYKHFDD